jgi:uncharacterized protein
VEGHIHGDPAEPLSYGLAFLAGLLGSGHCLGMCGSLVSAFFMKLGVRSALPHLAYHGGRLAVYATVGLIAATLGAVLVQAGTFGQIQGLLQIVAGLVVIILGLDLLGLSPWRNTIGFAPFAWVRRVFFSTTQRGPVIGALAGGVLNGLMPCSMTMAMAVKATTVPQPLDGALLMLAFGAGTLPSMFSAGFLFSRLGVRARGWLLRGAAIVVIVLGVATMWQGIQYYLVMHKLLG